MKYLIVYGAGLLIGIVASTANFAQQQPASGQDRSRESGRPEGSGENNGSGGRNGFRGPPGPGGPMGFMAQEREIVKEFDKNSNGYLDQVERQAAREFLKKQPATGGFGGRPGGMGGPNGPGFAGGPGGPGGFIAKPLTEALDADHDGKVALEELRAGARRLIKEVDRSEKAMLDSRQLADVVNRIVPPPPFGFPGGPGGGPGGPPGADRPDDQRRENRGRPEPESPRNQDGNPTESGRPQQPPRRDERGARAEGDRGDRGPRGFGGFNPGAAGFGPGNMIADAIVRRSDSNKDGKVSADELVAAANSLFKEVDENHDDQLSDTELARAIGVLAPAGPGFGPPGGFGRREPGKPGPKVALQDVKNYGEEPLYDPGVLRTLFLDFEETDWEAELAEFRNTDVEVPVTLTVDGKKYHNVGVTFRGMSSYGMIPAGSKRSFNLSVDLADEKQRLLGYKTLNLLNANDDPSFLSTVLYSHIARKHIPAPKANFVKVVINGESWGVYVNVQQFNKEFLTESYQSAKGTRWKVKGSPGGGGGLEYLGDNVEDYKRRYQLKSSDGEKAWKALIAFCKTLNETPADKLEEALKPMLDVDQALWFLALDVALINNDGYWVRASDYSIFLDHQGKFHFIPHDMNEAFHGAMMGFGGRGPGGPGGPGPGGPGFGGPGGFGGGGRPMGPEGRAGGREDRPGTPGEGGPDRRPGGLGGGTAGGGMDLDPLVALDDARKPLRSKLLAVPSLKKRYLEFVRTIAEEDLKWETLRPVIAAYRTLIENEIKIDTRKLTSFAEFEAALNEASPSADKNPAPRRPSLRNFVDQRRAFLLKYEEKTSKKVAASEK